MIARVVLALIALCMSLVYYCQHMHTDERLLGLPGRYLQE